MNLREIKTEWARDVIEPEEGVACGEEGKAWSNDYVRMQVTSVDFHPGPMTTEMGKH